MRSLILFVLLFLYSCSGGSDMAGGSSSETTSGFIVVSSAGTLSGKALASSTVMLFDSEYNPLTREGYADTVTLEGKSSFSFEALEEGSYNLFAFDNSSDKKLMISVTVDDSLRHYREKYHTPGSVSGILESEEKTVINSKVALLGTPFITELNNEAFTFDDLPKGNYRVMYQYEGWSTTDQFVENKEITIISDTTVEWTK